DSGNGDYHLQDNSTCINAGIDEIQIGGVWYYSPPDDIEGNPRPNPSGSMPDIGAYESLLANPVSVEENEMIIPTGYALYQNFPNPFNPSTTIISYSVAELSFVTLKVYDVLGNEIVTLINEEMPVGSYNVEFKATQLPSGIYFYRLQAGSFVETKKMVLMK
ncbi:MAG: T9SS type A sorting domain-containing protein, partial [Ignavibacteriaceae bacterium]